MQKRKLGKTDLEVSALGLGCMGMSRSIDWSLSCFASDPYSVLTKREVDNQRLL